MNKILPKVKNAEGVFGEVKQPAFSLTEIAIMQREEPQIIKKSKPISLKKRLDAVTKEFLLESLERHKGNISAVTKEFGHARSFLYGEMKRLKIKHQKFGSGLKSPRKKKKSKKK